ncbi:MAG TPA: methionine ABC transporter permease [Erysipelothrix sp.]
MQAYFTNLINYWPEFLTSIYETILMMLISGFFITLLGLILGSVTFLTKEKGLLENKVLNHFLNIVINSLRAIPFVILITLLLPITRWIVSTPLGVKGALVPLIFGATPFFARQVETALSEVDHGLIEAAQSMGLSNLSIITKVYLREAKASIYSGLSTTLINLLGLTTISGTMGAGGLGVFVQRYGYVQGHTDITIASIIVIIIIVSIIQSTSKLLIKRKSF